MQNMIGAWMIENSVLKAYFGRERIVVVPDGVKKVGGIIQDEDRIGKRQAGDLAGYRAFYRNKSAEVICLPDSVEEISFKAFAYCANLKVLAFSSNMKRAEVNAFVGCNNLKVLLFHGTILQLDDIQFDWFGGKLNLEVCCCTDGTLNFGREYYIEDYSYSGTTEEWNAKMAGHWLTRRAKNIHCSDGVICH